MHNTIKKLAPSLYYRLAGIKRFFRVIKFRQLNLNEIIQRDGQLYEKFIGKKLDWNNLHTYSEKMQAEKIYDSDSRKSLFTDKYAVREWVSQIVGEDKLIPLLGVWKSEKDIDFNILPNEFVLKTNCGSGDVIIVRDKASLSNRDIKVIRSKLRYYLNYNFACDTFELHYSEIEPKIIAEKLMHSEDGKDIMDYKFFCFDGVPYFCWVDVDRFSKHRRNIYDMKWRLQSWNQYKGTEAIGNSDTPVNMPKNFDGMVHVAKKLSFGFSHVRVDLYNINGKCYFGEMTFTNGSGLEVIYPDQADLMLGKLWNIDYLNIRKGGIEDESRGKIK